MIDMLTHCHDIVDSLRLAKVSVMELKAQLATRDGLHMARVRVTQYWLNQL
jgi:hypothetical protein